MSGAPDADEYDLAFVEMYVGDLAAQVEFWATRYGFEEVAVGGSPEQGFQSLMMAQGSTRLVLTEATSPDHAASRYVSTHGDGIAVIALGTTDVGRAIRRAAEHGARLVASPGGDGGEADVRVSVPGLGDVVHSFVEVDGQGALLPRGFRQLHRAEHHTGAARGTILTGIDHFALCLAAGDMDCTARHYTAAYGFREIFAERIVVGSQAMLSKVVQNQSRTVTLTLIEPDSTADPGQIDTFLENHCGSGVQHIAFRTEDIVSAVGGLGSAGVEFLTTPKAYYDAVSARFTPENHVWSELEKLGVLMDTDEGGQLFQIFTASVHRRRTLFFEIVERCGADTFGSSNIKALYEAVEHEMRE